MTDLASVTVSRSGGTCVVTIDGEVDLANAATVGDAAQTAIPKEARRVRIDLSKTRYLDSAAIRMLFRLVERIDAHRQEVELVVPPSSPVRRTLEVAGVVGSVPVLDAPPAEERAPSGELAAGFEPAT